MRVCVVWSYARVGFLLLLLGSEGLNSDSQAWQQVSLADDSYFQVSMTISLENVSMDIFVLVLVKL